MVLCKVPSSSNNSCLCLDVVHSSSTIEGLSDLGLSPKMLSPSLKHLNQFCITRSVDSFLSSTL